MEKSYVMPKHYSAVLVAAAESGSIPMVKLLLKHIPDTDYQRLGATYIAARNGDLPMLRFLKEQGIPFIPAVWKESAMNAMFHKAVAQNRKTAASI